MFTRRVALLKIRSKLVARAAAARRAAHENTLFDQRQNIAQRRILGTFGKLRILRCRQGTCSAPASPLIQRHALNAFPETRFGENTAQDRLRSVDRAPQTTEKPFHPSRNIHCAFLARFEDVIVGIALLPDLRRHAVKALRTRLRTRQGHIGNGARDAAVAVVKGMK